MADRENPGLLSTRRCGSVTGFSLQVAVCVPANYRFRPERLRRYTGRPPVATERPSLLPDSRHSVGMQVGRRAFLGEAATVWEAYHDLMRKAGIA